MESLPAMAVFHDVPVVPVTRVSRSVPTGGPIWPDFDRQIDARHCRGPLIPSAPTETPA